MSRAASKTRIDGIDYRILSKIYGLRFVVSITGIGGRFYIVNLFVAIGRSALVSRMIGLNVSSPQVPVLVSWCSLALSVISSSNTFTKRKNTTERVNSPSVKSTRNGRQAKKVPSLFRFVSLNSGEMNPRSSISSRTTSMVKKKIFLLSAIAMVHFMKLSESE